MKIKIIKDKKRYREDLLIMLFFGKIRKHPKNQFFNFARLY